MRPPQWLLLASLLAAALASAAAACGDGSNEAARSVDLSGIPTATLPDPLPEPIILGEVRPPPEGTSYTIVAGDTLGSIAQRFGTTVEAIIAANTLDDPTQLDVGQVLIIPGASGGPPEQDVLPATVEPTPSRPAGEATTYTVQLDDNASDIADSFGVTLDELIAANDTTLEAIRRLEVGEVLTIPAPSATPAP